MKRAKPLAYLAPLAVLAAMALGAAGCAWLQKPCQDPMSCDCPSSQNPACAPWPNDDTKAPVKKTCYRMTMGCSDIEWGPPDAHGNRKGKCVAAPEDAPRQISCDGVPGVDAGADQKTTDGGSRP